MTFYTAYCWNEEIQPKHMIKGYASFNEAEKNLYKDCRINPRSIVGQDMCSILVEVKGEWYDCWRSVKNKEVFCTKIFNRNDTCSLHHLIMEDKNQKIPGWRFKEVNLPEKDKGFWTFACPHCGAEYYTEFIHMLPDGCRKCFHHVGPWTGEVSE